MYGGRSPFMENQSSEASYEAEARITESENCLSESAPNQRTGERLRDKQSNCCETSGYQAVNCFANPAVNNSGKVREKAV